MLLILLTAKLDLYMMPFCLLCRSTCIIAVCY